MVKPRVEETDSGITGQDITTQYDQMQRGMRDRGWLETKALIASGVDGGHALELGPGPGYLGLEWLKAVPEARLTGLDISPDMQALARKNATEYGLDTRAEYVLGTGLELPFEDQTFDHAFSAGSLHEWADPIKVLTEIDRVLKPGGRLFIADLRRDLNPLIKAFMGLTIKPKTMKPGLKTSLAAAYTSAELADILAKSPFGDAAIKKDPFGLSLTARKG